MTSTEDSRKNTRGVYNKHPVDTVNATGNSNLLYSTILGRHSPFSWLPLDPTMDPSDPGAKLPEGTHGKPKDTNGRKEHSPRVPPEPSGSSPTLGIVTKREPSGKGGKGKSSTPKKRSSSQSSIPVSYTHLTLPTKRIV